MDIRKGALLSILWLCVGPLSLWAQEATKDRPVDLPKYLELTPRIGTGGQPTSAGFRLLAEKGYKAVINLRTSNEGFDLAAEVKALTDLGLRYYNIPVVGKEPREEQAAAFLKLMEDLKDDRVFVHCAAANRVGGFMIIQRVLKDGIPLEKAEEEARQIGLRSENLLKFARDFISRRRALSGCGPQARWLCCSLLTYHLGYSSSLASRQRAWGPAAKCQVILARALRQPSDR